MITRRLVLLLLLVGCSTPAAVEDASVADTGAVDAVVDAGNDANVASGDLSSAYCTPLAQLVCQRASDCGCGESLPGGTLDVAACTSQWTATCVEAWQPFLDAGAVLDPVAAAACVELSRETTTACARPSGVVPAAVCAPFAIDPSAFGASCSTPYCAGGDGRCIGGTCVAAPGAGATCGDTYTCATGLVCAEGACQALAEAGATCDGELDCAPPLACIDGECAALGAVGATCADESTCGAGLACVDDACAAPSATACDDGTSCGQGSVCAGVRTCAPRRASGACSDDRDCVPSLYCADGACVARPALGESCARGTLCGEGLGCDGDGGLCAPLPGLGDTCAFGEMGPFLCGDGLACTDDTCGALPVEGEPCTGDNRCAEGLGCDFSPAGSFCIVPRGAGGSCESDRSCAAAFHCGGSGTCEADLPAGSPCSVGNECAGVCGRSAGGGFECHDAPVTGDACLFSDECPATDACLALEQHCAPPICREL